MVLLDNEMTMDPTEDEMSEWDELNDRQKEMAEDLAEIALKFGMFDQGIGPNGAHYAPPAKNVFKSSGIKCEDCIFFNASANQCIIVEGLIEAEGVCKLWIIPESDIMEYQQPEETTKSMWSGAFDPRSVNKIV